MKKRLLSMLVALSIATCFMLAMTGTASATDSEDACVTFTSTSEFSISARKLWTTTGTMYYKNGGEWTEWDGSSVTAGTDGTDYYLKFRGEGITTLCNVQTNDEPLWTITGSGVAVSGNMETLLDYQKVVAGSAVPMTGNTFSRFLAGRNTEHRNTALTSINGLTIPFSNGHAPKGCCEYMFFFCTNITDASDIRLSASTVEAGAYSGMFEECMSLEVGPSSIDMSNVEGAGACSKMFCGCNKLKSAVEMPNVSKLPDSTCYQMYINCGALEKAFELKATEIGKNCYEDMFEGCYELKTAPEIKAEKVGIKSCSGMFNHSGISTAPSKLPATELAESCYEEMFYCCFSLISASELPATKLARNCYKGMFTHCEILETAPKLPANTLAENCYKEMFSYCKKLKTAPEMSAKALAESCCESMFTHCEILETAPELPAKTLAKNCYCNMFSNCYLLSEAPELPAEEMEEGCYKGMFSGCGYLKTSPELPATTLAPHCYEKMFEKCEWLKTTYDLPAETLCEGCYSEMFIECIRLAVMPKISAKSMAASCCEKMFYGCKQITLYETGQGDTWSVDENATTCEAWATDMLTSTGGTFTGVPEPGKTYYTLPADYVKNCTINITSDSTYDGTEQKPEVSITDFKGNTFKPGESFTVSYTENINAGTATVTITSNEIATDKNTKNFTIAKRTVSFRGKSEDLVENGTEQSLKDYTVSGDGLVSGHTVNIQAEAKGTSPGEYEGNITAADDVKIYDAQSKDVTANYEITCTPGILRILSSEKATIVFDMGGHGKKISSQEVNIGAKLTEPAEPTEEAYVFCGWYTDSDFSTEWDFDKDRVSTESTRTLYAEWQKRPADSLLFTSPSSFKITACDGEGSSVKTWSGGDNAKMEYSFDNSTWKEWTGATQLTAEQSDGAGNYNIYLRGKDITVVNNLLNGTCWTLNGSNISCIGNIMTLLDYEKPDEATMGEGCFCGMFFLCTALTKAPELPATELSPYCYYGMFFNCTNLKEAPELPAKKMEDSCYMIMFANSGITKAPELPATELADSCYSSMFINCANIKFSTAGPGATGSSPADALRADSWNEDMFANTAGDLTDDPKIGVTYYQEGLDKPEASDFEFEAPTKLEYDGQEKKATVTVKAGITGMGEITVNYYDEAGNKLDSAPKEAGTYTVSIDVAKSDYYKAITGLTDDTWTFTISNSEAKSISRASNAFIARGTANKSTNTIKWNAVNGATAYDVYCAKCGKSMKKVKTTKVLKYTKKGLNRKKCYKYKVKAYKKIGNKKVYLSTSPTIHIAGVKDKRSNALAVKVSAATISLDKGQTAKVEGKIIKKSARKTILWKRHISAPVLYMSTDKSVVTVDSKGGIKAKSEGEAYIYAYAASGAFAKTLVTVGGGI